MNSFSGISKQSVKSQTVFESFYKKKSLLAVSNLFRSFITPGKLYEDAKFA